VFDGPNPLITRVPAIKATWLVLAVGVFALTLFGAIDYANYDDGARRGLFALAIVGPTLLSFPLGLLAAITGSMLFVGLEKVMGLSIMLESIQPVLLAGFVLAVGYYQWFALLPRIIESWRSRARS